jgi:NAD(P)-dependent dehydrogenase (short-subunit alcohol dehydrogenase family)
VSGKRIFITGGASGLGKALALRYARDGWRVCIGDLDVARCQETLASLPGGHALACDVTREGDLEAAAAWLEAHWGGVDVLVNNAGVAQVGGITDVTMEDWRWIIDINLLGVVRGCKAFVPLLRRVATGGSRTRIVNVASMAGLLHPPRSAAYSATKAAVVALSEVLKLELADGGVDVTVVCPGFFRTNLAANMRASDLKSEQVTHKLVDKARFGADEIAERVFRGVAEGEFMVLTHREETVAWWMKRFLPYGVYLAAMKRQARGGRGKKPPAGA